MGDFDLDFFDLLGEAMDGAPIDFGSASEGQFTDGVPTAPVVAADAAPDALITAYQNGTFDPATASPADLEAIASQLGIPLPSQAPQFTAFSGDVNAPLGSGGSASEGQFTGAGDAPLAGADLPTMQQLEAELKDPVLKNVFYDTSTQTLRAADGSEVKPGSDTWNSIKAAVAKVDNLLGSNLGKLGGVAALGGLGVGLGRLLAGGAPTFKPPVPPPPTPQVAAGQQALLAALNGTTGGLPGAGGTSSADASIAAALLRNPQAVAAILGQPGLLGPGASGAADLGSTVSYGLAGQRNVAQGLSDAAARELITGAQQAPQESLLRMQALGMLPNLLDPSVAAVLSKDPLALASYVQAYNAVTNPASNPMLEQQFAKEERELRNGLYRDLGPGYETSTPGIQALQELQQKHDALRANDARAQATTYATLTQGRENAAQNVRQTAVQQNTGITQGVGRTPLGTTGTSLNSIVPTFPLLGIDQTNTDRSTQQTIANQAAIAAFNSQAASKAALANSVGSVFGNAAGGLGGGGFKVTKNADGSTSLSMA